MTFEKHSTAVWLQGSNLIRMARNRPVTAHTEKEHMHGPRTLQGRAYACKWYADCRPKGGAPDGRQKRQWAK